nr:ABC transporter ATP-binding protein [Bifidobacterium choladohabitans]
MIVRRYILQPVKNNSGEYALSCCQVRKSYGSRQVIKGVDLQVRRGSILGLLGRNGAGKSTLISALTGLGEPDSGHISVEGHNPYRTPSRIFGRIIGLAPQDLGIYPHLSVRDNLCGMAGLQGLNTKQCSKRADELIELMGLGSQSGTAAENLSGGQKRRLHTAMAMVHNPPVLFLDEPTVGADVEARARILDMVKAMSRQGTTIIYTTHYLKELEEMGADLAFLIDGRIKVQGSLQEVLHKYARASLRISFVGQAPGQIPGWQMTDGFLEPDHPVSSPEQELARLLQKPVMKEARLSSVTIVQPDIESAYMAVMGVSSSNPAGSPAWEDR